MVLACNASGGAIAATRRLVSRYCTSTIAVAERKVYNIVHLIYRTKNYEGHSRDYEFSRLSMQEHWRAGYHDARRTPRHREVLERPRNHEGVYTFDLAAQGRE
jgi:NTE family protein